MVRERVAAATDGMRFRMLGPMTARTAAGASLDLGPNQQRALLAVLLLRTGRTATTAELCDALWGERVPPRAVGTLRTYASRLRALFEPDRPPRAPARLLVYTSGGYALRLARPLLDVTAFERGLAEAARLRAAGAVRQAHGVRGRALALWAGSPLAGLPGPHAEAQRDRLTGLWLAAREDHFHDALELGPDRDTAAVPALRAFAAEHPLRERAQALLMRALHRGGRSGEALAVYESARETLGLELGVTPGPELAALHGAVRKSVGGVPGGPRRAEPPSVPVALPEPVPAPVPAPVPVPVFVSGPDLGAGIPPDGDGLAPAPLFVGRAAECALLARLFSGAATGVPVAVLTGMPGVGKTALASRVAGQVRALFPDGVLRAGLGAGRGAALGVLLRALGTPGAAVPEDVEARAALYRSLLAGRRVLVLLDDARDTAEVLALLPGAPGCAALVTAASRAIVVPGARMIDVPEWDEATAREFLGAVSGARRVRRDPAGLRELLDRCAGLPLALELAASPRADGRAVEDGFRRRAEGLSEAAVRALRAVAMSTAVTGAATAPDGFTVAEAAALLDGPAPALRSDLAPGPETARALEELVDSCLLAPGPSGRYRLHPLVGEFAVREFGPWPGPPHQM
ncbi:NB-ARC domain-containing protein [Streptomyces sp. NBC_00536]|uniref:AfsR/SARP family transcriptional regulator n=1 Tax=Streptomyces sp. NBC_00536 TaxID=2975769 RepID=UPI002E82002F|nr:BTAD domain-containing putative transcriptional regulator [Streptomyces sp. NBC_00536]WUC82848.1 NB-ARC domain-containing protein [Streptomyces sp. NBC_00536]